MNFVTVRNEKHKKRIISSILLLGILLFSGIGYEYGFKFNDLSSVSNLKIINVYISHNDTAADLIINYSISLHSNVQTKIEGKISFLNYTMYYEQELTSNKNIIRIPCDFLFLYSHISTGINIQFEGTLFSVHKSNIFYFLKQTFNLTYILLSYFTFNTEYKLLNSSHSKAIIHGIYVFPIVSKNLPINISYQIYFELIKSEMETLNFSYTNISNGIHEGFILLKNSSFLFSNSSFQNSFTDEIVFNLNKTLFYGFYHPDVIDYCGKALDLRIATDLKIPQNTAPDPILYFNNINVSINTNIISYPDSYSYVHYIK